MYNMKEKIILFYGVETIEGACSSERGPYLTYEEANKESNKMYASAASEGWYDLGGESFSYGVNRYEVCLQNEVLYKGTKYGLYCPEDRGNLPPHKTIVLKERIEEGKAPVYEIVENAEKDQELLGLLGA